MSDMKCELQIPDVPGLEAQQLTVGRIFYFHCSGTWPKLQVENLKLQAVPAEAAQVVQTPYDLRLLGFEMRDPQTADLKFTSYTPGNHNFSALNLSDGTAMVNLPPLNIQVHSVLQPNQKVEPFGPVGPMKVGVPWVYWIILTAVLGIAVFSGLLVWKRRQNRLEILGKIKRLSTGQSSLVQFHRELRGLTKRAGLSDIDQTLKMEPALYLQELRSLCEIYWGQKFKLALLDRPKKFLRPEFKSVAPKIYIRHKQELLFWDQKWHRLFQSRDKTKFEDFIEFTQVTRGLIEKMEDTET